jgi:hypothetical protein
MRVSKRRGWDDRTEEGRGEEKINILIEYK